MLKKSKLIKPIAKLIHHKINKEALRAIPDQIKLREELIRKAKNTIFGLEHNFHKISDYTSFKNEIPLRNYEQLKPYIERIVAGEENILWSGKPVYFAKTSGTTSGVKFIPITKASLPYHVNSARNAFFCYLDQHKHETTLDGKLIFLSGSPELHLTSGIKTGRLSGIVNHEIPSWLQKSQLPSYETNCIDDWEQKLDKIVDETIHEDLRMISGIPPWVKMYYEKLIERSGKSTIKEIFPNFNLFVYGGVNFEPYRTSLESLVGGKVDSIETYPASEGFIAFQNDATDPALLLNTNAGIFFEFVPANEIFSDSPARYALEEIELGIDYAIIINSNAGLWGYILGDQVRFTRLNPYKLLVTGRINHYTSAFGEHVIGKEVDESILEVSAKYGIKVREFTVAPQVNPTADQLPYHEWFVEFESDIGDISVLAQALDQKMTEKNIYYHDLIKGNILSPLRLRPLKEDSFRNLMKDMGKLGGQNKVPRLSNDRKIAERLQVYLK